MKKLTIALALLLCLVLCLFAFASCGKKKKKAATEAPATTTAHVHVPAENYTTDKAATCGAAGSESKHCTVCGEIIESTIRAIQATGEHTFGDWVETTPPSVIADGVKMQTCSVCDQKNYGSITKTEATVQTWTAEATGKYSNSKEFSEIQDGKHFYPTEDNPDGNDLLVEYSLLWNDTLLNLDPTTNKGSYAMTKITDANGAHDNDLAWWSLTDDVANSWCKFAGGFEAANLQRVAPDGATYTPLGMCAENGDYDAYPNIGGADRDNPEYGWHRFGLRFHQEVTNESVVRAGGTAVYEFAITLYFDGVPVSKLVGKTTGDQQVPRTDNYLFTAKYDKTDGIKYEDNPELDRTVYAILVNSMVAKADTVAYWADADYFYTCGKDFVQKVAPANDPQDTSTIELAEGVTRTAKAWFKLIDSVAPHDHVYNVDAEVTKAATLLANGTKVMKCAYCDATKEVDYAYYPEVFKWDKKAGGNYSPEQTTLGEVRGDKHFYEEGNDLLIEYSFLWNETTPNLGIKDDKDNDCKPFIDTRFESAKNGYGKNVIYWSPAANIIGSDCTTPGGFEYGGIELNMPDNPYSRFKGGGDDRTAYPNIGGENNGDGTTQVNNLYGWHRVSIRYRNEVTNKDALIADTTAGATPAEYNLEAWIYIDGKLVVHAYNTDLIANDAAHSDRKLFSARSDGQGGIVYTENDALVLHPVRLNSKKAAVDKTVYYSVADISMSAGANFVQKVGRIDEPKAAELQADPTHKVTSTMWYKIVCEEHTWDNNFTETAATILNDGEKVEHCSVCGMARKETIPFELSVYNSKSPSGYAYASGEYFAMGKSIAKISGEDHFYPDSTEIGAQGKDLWFEYSFLWNDTLYNWDVASCCAEMKMFGFRTWGSEGKHKEFYYLYTRNNNDGFATSGSVPHKGHFDYSTYKKNCDPGWSCAVDPESGHPIYTGDWIDTKPERTPSIGENGWHRLGFRFHQEVASVSGSTVTYSGYSELYIDGVKVWKVYSDMQDGDKGLKQNGLLLWTATAENDVITGYQDNDAMELEMRIDLITKSTNAVYVAVDDVHWTCGNGFVRNVEQVATPAAKTIILDNKGNDDPADDVTASGAIFFRYAD